MLHASADIRPHSHRCKGPDIRRAQQHQPAGGARNHTALDGKPATTEAVCVVGFRKLRPCLTFQIGRILPGGRIAAVGDG